MAIQRKMVRSDELGFTIEQAYSKYIDEKIASNASKDTIGESASGKSSTKIFLSFIPSEQCGLYSLYRFAVLGILGKAEGNGGAVQQVFEKI